MKLVMLGIVGAGKGTQAVRLAEFVNVPHISTGDIFRDAVEKGTELGLKAKQIMNEGGLVPDELVLGIVQERLSQADVAGGYILDGFPRTINQAEEFDKIESLDNVIYITIPEEEVIKRLTGRRNCEKCNAQYNTYLDNIDDTCKKCGGKIVKRDDDNEETIKVRIVNYINQTQPLIDYYKQKNILIEIDGTKSIDEVFENVKQSIGN
jgi:adenylate kinase